MINLETLFKNHFDTKEISDDNMRKFAEAHLQRLAANNGGGEFTLLITTTTTAYTDYFGSLTDEDTKFAIQQGLTITVNNAVEAFKKAVSRREGAVRSTFEKESAQYQEFFPQGLTEYSNAILANVEVLMTRFADAAVKYVAELGAPLGTEFNGYLTTFKAARTAQLLKLGEVAGSKTGTATKRDALEIELMRNVHMIGGMFVGEVDKCMDFFDQSFIKSSSAEEDEEEQAA